MDRASLEPNAPLGSNSRAFCASEAVSSTYSVLPSPSGSHHEIQIHAFISIFKNYLNETFMSSLESLKHWAGGSWSRGLHASQSYSLSSNTLPSASQGSSMERYLRTPYSKELPTFAPHSIALFSSLYLLLSEFVLFNYLFDVFYCLQDVRPLRIRNGFLVQSCVHSNQNNA